MEAILNYWNRLERSVVSKTGFRYRDMSSEIVNQKTINGETEIDLFVQFYKLNNSLRYCNGSYYEWVDKTWKDKYAVWLKSDDYKKKSFNLFYGNGVVD